MNKKKSHITAPKETSDESIPDRWMMYDNIPYAQDKDICDSSNITLESGNIIKSYRCLLKDTLELKRELINKD